MNAERLLQHYEHIADAPNAIARLRRFILDLAVRGKLVPQDSGDEPASELLKRIAKAKSHLYRKERAKRQSEDLTRDGAGFVMPVGWTLAPLANLVEVINGRAYKQQELLGAGVPVLRVGNLFTSDKWYYSDLQLPEDKYCERGDLIFSWSASFGPFIWDGDKVIYHYHIWKLVLHSEADLSKHYLYDFLLQKTREIKEAGHGVSMIHMTKEKMERLSVPLPPLAEQHRIVAKIDELMALCDQLEAARTEREAKRDGLAAASLARLNTPNPETFRNNARFALNALPALSARPDQIKRLRQTIINLAVRGKLVLQDVGDEPAFEMLKRIAKEKVRLVKVGEIRKSRPLPEVTTEDLPFELPSGWVCTRLGDVIHLVSGQHLQPPEYSEDPKMGLPYITGPSDFGAGGLEISRYALVRKAVAKQGQLLLTVKGSGVGKTVICDIPEVAISRQLMALTAIEWNDHFLLLITHRLAEKLKSEARSLIPGISREDVDEFAVALPPLTEQHRIVSKVDELMTLCDELETSLVTADATRKSLLEALLAQALAPVDAEVLQDAAE